MLSWRVKRQLLYFLGLLLIITVIAAGIFFVYKPRVSCFDGKQNGTEIGIDCGGGCAAVCKNEPQPLSVLYARVLPLGDGRYDLIAMVENQNLNLGVSRLAYNFRVVDDQNVLITSRAGATFINPHEKAPVFETNITPGERVPKDAFLEIDPNLVWQRVSTAPPTFGSENGSISASGTPALVAAVTNQTLAPLTNIEVVAIVSDAAGNAIAASRTVIASLAAGAKQAITFTWPAAFRAPAGPIEIYPRIKLVP